MLQGNLSGLPQSSQESTEPPLRMAGLLTIAVTPKTPGREWPAIASTKTPSNGFLRAHHGLRRGLPFKLQFCLRQINDPSSTKM